MRGLISIPTYNEAEVLPQTLESIFSQFTHADVLVIDDNSPDGTYKIVQELITSERYGNRLHLLHRTSDKGFASAYKAGCRYFLEGRWDYLQLMDADGSHSIETLPQFFQGISEGYNVVVGSRYVDGGGYQDWPWSRVMLSSLGQFYTRCCLGKAFHDWTSGFVAIERQALAEVDFQNFEAAGFAILIELKATAAQRGARCLEVPILFKNRELGESKISNAIILEGLRMPWLLRRRFQK